LLAAATVNKALEHLVRLGIVTELTKQKRNRLFSFIVEIYTNLSNDSFINFAGSGNSE